MADERIKEYWSREMDALLETYEQFQTLLPSETDCGAAHKGEDGRYVEHLVREYLRRYLPKDLEVLTGFILRPAVLCGKSDKSRKKDEHKISGQLDILVYDTAHYPVYQRFGESVIVPPEGVAAILSVKKYLRPEYIESEAESLLRAVRLCPHKLGNGKKAKCPFTALISIEDKYGEKNQTPLTKEQKGKATYDKLEKVYTGRALLCYDEMADFVGSLAAWGLYKDNAKGKKEASYLFFEYDTKKRAMGFQLMLQKILDVYYQNSSEMIARPGFVDNRKEQFQRKFGPISYGCQEIDLVQEMKARNRKRAQTRPYGR
ncbi:MAG: hypothetical protein HFH49_14595 [Lachnospiraceae bacterium]|nr:hypothetical protein [Lachnospiraceae bacterium]